MPRIDPEFDRNVFLNWPYDQAYAPISEAIVFAIEDSGFHARSARERLDSSQVRLHKIVDLIRNTRFSIHDLSRTQLDETTDLPRFNMPLELGIDIGCKAFSRVHARKSFLIFDSKPHRFHKYLSDIGGQDIQHHGNDPKTAVARVRDWLRSESGLTSIPGGARIYDRYLEFRRDLSGLCVQLRLDAGDLSFVDLAAVIGMWSEDHR